MLVGNRRTRVDTPMATSSSASLQERTTDVRNKGRQALWLAAFGSSALLGSAHAALLQASGPSESTAFDSQLTTSALIYDANFYSASQGRLVIVASGSSLRGPGVPGSNGIAGTAPSQLYLNAGDQLRDLIIELRLHNSTGALISGSVVIPRDNNSAAAGTAGDSWTAAGAVTAFGWSDYVAAGTNTFDLRWGVNSYDFSDVVANPGLVGGSATCNVGSGGCAMGYMRFSTAGIAFTANTTNAPVNFGIDWVRGASVISGSTPNAQLGTYDDGIAAAAYLNNAVTADVFLTPVPLPTPLALLAVGLAAVVPLMRRRMAQD